MARDQAENWRSSFVLARISNSADSLCVSGSPARPFTQISAFSETTRSVDYYLVIFAKYKAGAQHEAGDIARKYFVPVDRAVGRHVIGYSFLVGSWDDTLFFRLEGGLADLEWEQSPINLKWGAELAKQTGSEDRANEIWNRYQSLIEKSETAIATRPKTKL